MDLVVASDTHVVAGAQMQRLHLGLSPGSWSWECHLSVALESRLGALPGLGTPPESVNCEHRLGAVAGSVVWERRLGRLVWECLPGSIARECRPGSINWE